MNNLLINMIEDRIKQLEEDTKLCIDERLLGKSDMPLMY